MKTNIKRPCNPWITHLTKFRKDNPKMSLTEAMKKAKVTYAPKK